jgi:hypothetical protein
VAISLEDARRDAVWPTYSALERLATATNEGRGTADVRYFHEPR